MDEDDVPALTAAQAGLLTRMAGGASLVQPRHGLRSWSLEGDPDMPIDDVSPRQLRAKGLVALVRCGSAKVGRLGVYNLTLAGRAALLAWRMLR